MIFLESNLSFGFSLFPLEMDPLALILRNFTPTLQKIVVFDLFPLN